MDKKKKLTVVLSIVGMAVSILALVAITIVMNPGVLSFDQYFQKPSGPSEQEIANKKKAEQIAITHVQNNENFLQQFNTSNLQATETIASDCNGCWKVTLNFPSDTINEQGVQKPTIYVTLKNWEVEDVRTTQGGSIALSPNECQEQGGEIVNAELNKTCNLDQKQIGEVKGFISLHICCVKN